ncbi:uncharacterized protein LOC134270016 [Saccostrea cucullata]|uniref:uncharacterized protein LOC134270016 n=1 Tax=Saccostrea cuccullata TaxID=36930 RepID=UPI002ED3F83D
MEHLTTNLILLAVIISCVFALVPKSKMKCECTCSPTSNPSKKYLAVGNLEASFKPKTETVIKTETIPPSVPQELLDSPFRNVDSSTKQDSKSPISKTIKESEADSKSLPIKQKLPIVKKVAIPPVPPVPPVLSYSSNPVIESTVSPTTATVRTDSPNDLSVTPSAFRKAQRMTLKESNEPPINKVLKSPIDSRKINQLTKSEVITLDDIIFGKVPYDFGSRGIQRKFLTETKELDAKTNTPSTLDYSKTTVNKTTSAKTMITETTASKTPKSTSGAPETTILETTVTETTTPETTTIEETSSTTSLPTEMLSSTTPTTITTTYAPTTMPTTTKSKSNRGLLPLFRTAYSKKPKNPETPKTTNAPTSLNSKPETKTVTTIKTVPTTTTPSTTTQKPTTTTRAPSSTRKPRPTLQTTQRPSTKKQQTAPKKSTYNVQRPKLDNSAQSIVKSLISQNQVNPSYSFSESFKRNTIKNLLDAFKPNYMKKSLYTVTPNPRPKQVEVVQPYRPPAAGPSRMQLPVSEIQFGHFDERVSRIAPTYQVHSLGSLSSMRGQPPPSQQVAVVNSQNSPQQVVYQDRVQSSPERMNWNPVQEAKKWGEPVQEAKKWGEPPNWALSQQQVQQSPLQQQQLAWNSQNRQSWNSQQLQQQQQRNLEPQKQSFPSPGFAIAGETPQVPQKINPPFPGLQLPPKSQSPIDFRVH